MIGINTFASITIGSSEISMKIFEISSKRNIKQLDNVRYPCELGMETYSKGRLSHEIVNNVCDTLVDFTKIMKEYDVKDYIAVATSAVREASNCLLVLDRIKLVTGLTVSIVSNSQQRFLCYNAIALKQNEFNNFVGKGALVLDIGAGSIQLSVYESSTLRSTQNIKLGFLRIKELLQNSANYISDYSNVLKELIDSNLNTYSELYLKAWDVNNIIVISDNSYELNKIISDKTGNVVSVKEFNKLYNLLAGLSVNQVSTKLQISSAYASLVQPVAMIINKLIDITGATNLWFPGVNVNDGIVVEYISRKGKSVFEHDFENDALAAARQLAKKYCCDEKHSNNVESNALAIFDGLSKLHGLNKRDRLLLQIAIILHNSGKFINMNDVSVHSHHIIIRNEIIGISHHEREIIADIIDSNYNLGANTPDAIRIAKLSAIFKLADVLDKSHLQKIKNIQVSYKDGIIMLLFKCDKDITLEKIFFDIQAEYFSVVYGIVPGIKQIHI